MCVKCDITSIRTALALYVELKILAIKTVIYTRLSLKDNYNNHTNIIIMIVWYRDNLLRLIYPWYYAVFWYLLLMCLIPS